MKHESIAEIQKALTGLDQLLSQKSAKEWVEKLDTAIKDLTLQAEEPSKEGIETLYQLKEFWQDLAK